MASTHETRKAEMREAGVNSEPHLVPEIECNILDRAILLSSSVAERMGWIEAHKNGDPVWKWKGVTVNGQATIENGRIIIKNARVTRLNLCEQGITSEDAKGLVFPPRLESLMISENRLGLEGLKVMLKNLPSCLKKLWVGYNEIDDGCFWGVRFPESLEDLGLTYNNLGDKFARTVVFPLRLKNLYIPKNHFTHRGLRELRLPPFLEKFHAWKSGFGCIWKDESGREMNTVIRLPHTINNDEVWPKWLNDKEDGRRYEHRTRYNKVRKFYERYYQTRVIY